MSVTIVKGVTLATFSTVRASGNPQKTGVSGSLSAERLSAQAAARMTSDATVSGVRLGSQATIQKIRDQGEASEKAKEVAEQIREQEDQGEETHANLDPALVPDGFVV